MFRMQLYLFFVSAMFFIVTSTALSGQKIFTKSGSITFESDAPLETIKAQNLKAVSVLDLDSGKVEWSVLIKGFQFRKALMQVHFNENYMESTRYPKAKFIGTVLNIDEIKPYSDGEYHANVEGILDIHGVKKPLETDVLIHIEGGNISITCSFSLEVADFSIEIPGIVRNKIAKEVQLTIEAHYEKFTK